MGGRGWGEGKGGGDKQLVRAGPLVDSAGRRTNLGAIEKLNIPARTQVSVSRGSRGGTKERRLGTICLMAHSRASLY